MGSQGQLQHIARTTFQNMTRAPLTTVLTFVTMTFALFLLAGFLLFMQQLRTSLTGNRGEIPVTFYLYERATDDQARGLAAQLRQEPSVASVRLIDKQTALQEFRKSLGSEQAVLDGLETRNPLPISLEVMLSKSVNAEEAAPKLSNSYRDNPLVEFVQYRQNLVEQLGALLEALRLGGGLALGLMLLVTGFIIANTIKLALFAHREEIEIMRLVGATDRQIHLPYLIEGSLQGASGAFGALLSLNAVVAALNSLVQASPVVGMLVPEVSGVDLKVGSLILLVGLGVGLAGSYASVRKFLVD
jgi:cell division transport system permease protein